MTITTVHLNSAELPPILLRRGFEAGKSRDGVPVLDNGSPVYYAEAVLPGLLTSRFADTPGLGSARVKMVGTDPHIGPGYVRLEGRVVLSATYTKGASFRDATKSHVTVSAEKVRGPVAERPPRRSELLPVSLPVGAMLCEAYPLPNRDDGMWTATLALEAASSWVVDGLAELLVRMPVDEALIGSAVRPVGLTVGYSVPDAADVSERRRAALHLTCVGFEDASEAPSANGRGRRPEPQPEPVTVDS